MGVNSCRATKYWERRDHHFQEMSEKTVLAGYLKKLFRKNERKYSFGKNFEISCGIIDRGFTGNQITI